LQAGDGSSSESDSLAAGLYLVPTPIGNLGDITLRAMAVLRQASRIACEDTRVAQKLLSALGIAPAGRLVACHEHNAAAAVPPLVAAIAAGASVALSSDAGTPLLSDPGRELVAACQAAGLPVTALPGASALLPALQLSGLPLASFFFDGFLPAKETQRRRRIGELATVPATLVFYEAPHRLAESLADLAELLGVRPAAVARELTKRFEEVRRGSLAELALHYRDAGQPKGEIVLLVGPPGPAAAAPVDIDASLRLALATQSLRDAVAQIAAESGLSRREVYARALALQGDGDA
jgi:16S rRNA (cytidine1402-2'-O)-methyltransferase